MIAHIVLVQNIEMYEHDDGLLCVQTQNNKE